MGYYSRHSEKAESNSNTAIGGGTLVYSKHFPFGTDDDAENKKPTGA